MCSSICSPLNVNLNTLQITFNHNVLKMPYKRASTEMGRTCKTRLFKLHGYTVHQQYPTL